MNGDWRRSRRGVYDGVGSIFRAVVDNDDLERGWVILLLDDVFSELDLLRREYLIRQVLGHEQVLITATDFTSFPEEMLAKAYRYNVVNGEVLRC